MANVCSTLFDPFPQKMARRLVPVVDPLLTRPSAWRTIKLILEVDGTWNYTIMATLLNNTNGTRDWPVINSVVDSDCFNRGAFLIRNKHIPGQFWESDGSTIVASRELRTMFVVRGIKFRKDDDEQVLIRSDKMVIEVAKSTSVDEILFV